MQKKALFLAALVPLTAACEDSTGPAGSGQVAVRFQAIAPPTVLLSSSGAQLSTAPAPLTISGDNGTLVIEDIRLIVAELELERAGVECAGAEDEDACEEFEGGPFLVDLLDGGADEVVNARIPAGSYTEFEFEVENLSPDEDDSAAERQATEAVLAEIRQAYPDFPAEGSMVVRGTFEGAPFTVYFDAELEVEREFSRAFRVPEDGALTVHLDPAAWFRHGTEVVDLHAYDGQTIEIEAEFSDGVVEVEIDD